MRRRRYTCMRIALLSVLLASASVHADPVRDDIVDIRHGRSPDRRVFLGWTADGSAVEHDVLCAVQNDVSVCWSALVVSSIHGIETTRLFGIENAAGLSTDVAGKAIATERDTLATLGALTRDASADELTLIAAVDCDGVAIRRGTQTLGYAARIANPSCMNGMVDAETPSVSAPKIRGVHVAPDRHHVAVSVDYLQHRTTEQTRETVFVLLPI